MNCVPRIHKDKAGTLPIVLYQNEKLGDVNAAEIDIDDIDDNDDAETEEKTKEEYECESNTEFDAKSDTGVDKHAVTV